MKLLRYLPLLIPAVTILAQSPDALTRQARPPFQRNSFHANVATPGYTPFFVLDAYELRGIQNKGAGQTIAVIDAFDDPTAEADLATFTRQFQLPPCTRENGCFKLIYAGGKQPPPDTSGWSNEVAIDTQWAHAVAPAATIMLVESQSSQLKDLIGAVDVAIAHGATVVCMSWISSEAPDEPQLDTHFNVPGVTFVAASGDSGHGAYYPAASPYVVAVGGTSLAVNPNGTWANEAAWSGSGGGTSKFETEPSYQMAVQSTGKRGVPDVAYDGNPSTGVPAYNSHACGLCYTGWDQWGGTSIGTPQWAAVFAIANSLRVSAGKTRLTQPQFILYGVYALLGAVDYHDITSGANGSCGSECQAAPGYDFVTGLGSPIGGALITKLAGAR